MSEPFVGEIRIVGFNFAPFRGSCLGRSLTRTDSDHRFGADAGRAAAWNRHDDPRRAGRGSRSTRSPAPCHDTKYELSARRLYARAGFREVVDDGLNVSFERQPTQ